MKGPGSIPTSLWLRIEAEARGRARSNEPAHDFFHVERVVTNARAIARGEALEPESEAIVVTAALLHELYTLPKNHPDSALAGDRCADHARELLREAGAPASMIEPVALAIRDHSFSKGVVPEARESRVLQDADRLDAIGAIGLARMWATCADMKRPFYSPVDPFCATRAPDDKAWGLDHVFKKLLAIPARLHTDTARSLAEDRVAFLRVYVDQLRRELGEG
ncbi:MAG TPA: HD domain-containing protein [Labilithrix sp.]|nr:HD domain-containing protein [Labilithrix sp.]